MRQDRKRVIAFRDVRRRTKKEVTFIISDTSMSSKGLAVWKDSFDNTVFLDADNAFWGIGPFIPRDAISLYEKFKNRLDREINDFRFSTELSAIYIDPTDRCNARCPYCYVPLKTRVNGRSMSTKELDFILGKIQNYFAGKKRKPVIIFHASEPLLVKDAVFFAIHKYHRHFKFGLQTNATLMKKEDAVFLMRYRVGVGISLDASTALINNRLRPDAANGGNFKKALLALDWLDGYPGLNVITTVTKHNVHNLPQMVKFLHKKRVPCVLLNPVRLTQKNSRGLKPDQDVFANNFIRAVDTAMALSKKSKYKIIVGNFANVILAIVAPTARRLMCDISPCGGGRCFFTITASGEMIPCGEFIGLKGFSGGNIFKDSITDAMASPAFKKIRSRKVEAIEECDTCALRNICGAPCPAELHALGGMRQKSVFCEFYKKIIEHAFKVIAQRKEALCLRSEGLKNLQYQYALA